MRKIFVKGRPAVKKEEPVRDEPDPSLLTNLARGIDAAALEQVAAALTPPAFFGVDYAESARWSTRRNSDQRTLNLSFTALHVQYDIRTRSYVLGVDFSLNGRSLSARIERPSEALEDINRVGGSQRQAAIRRLVVALADYVLDGLRSSIETAPAEMLQDNVEVRRALRI